jgi:DNA-binding IclR family transcriptional regulator
MHKEGLTRLEAMILDVIADEPKTVDEIVDATGGARVYVRDILVRMDHTGLAVRHEPIPARWQAAKGAK